MSREAVKVLHERRQSHADAIEVIDAALRELGAVGVRKSRATRRGSNGGGGDRMKAAHEALAKARAARAKLNKATPKQLNQRRILLTTRKPVASLAEAVAD